MMGGKMYKLYIPIAARVKNGRNVVCSNSHSALAISTTPRQPASSSSRKSRKFESGNHDSIVLLRLRPLGGRGGGGVCAGSGWTWA